MASSEDEVPDLSAEGVHTIAAQLSRQAVDRIVGIVKRERRRGITENVLRKSLEKNLPDYDKHSLTMLLKLGSDEFVPDDFPADNVAKSERIKDNTLELTLVQIPKDINLFSLVRHQDQEWLVSEARRTTLTLKLLK
jgi:hypothetical protein